MAACGVRVRVVSPSAAHAQRLVELLGTALDARCSWQAEAQAGAVRLGPGAVLEVRVLPSPLLVAARGWLNRPPISRICGVAIETCDERQHGDDEEELLPSPQDPTSAATTTDWQAWLSEARPNVNPTLSVVHQRQRTVLSSSSTSSSSSSSSSSLLREVVLGASDVGSVAAALDGVGQPVPGRPNLLWLQPRALALRLIPSPVSSLVLRPPGGQSLGQVKEAVAKRGLQAHPIGLTGASAGQLLLTAPELDGLDLRFCAAPEGEPPVAFCEGDEVLRENVLEELNPSIGGGDSAASSSRTPAAHYQRMSGGGIGDCWSEFRATMRRPGGFLKK